MGMRRERPEAVWLGTSVSAVTRLRQRVLRVAMALGCAGAVMALVPGSALADLWVSSSGTDTGYCSQANPCATISRAVSLAIPNTTIFVGAGTFTDHVTIGSDVSPLTIQGAGAHTTTVSGGFNGSGSVFTISSASATINDVEIIGGTADNGGGVDALGSVTLDRDVVAFNEATGAANSQATGNGGGVYMGPATPESVIRDTTITANQAYLTGGGIYSDHGQVTRSLVYENSVSTPAGSGLHGSGGGVLSLYGSVTNTTIAANRVQATGGGPQGVGGGAAGYQTDFAFDTIAGNAAAAGGGLGLAAYLRANGTILAANTGGNCDGMLVSDAGYNLEDDAAASCGFSPASRDIVGADPGLAPVADNGGPTQTMALLPTSPAIGADGDSARCGATGPLDASDVDQRDFPRRSASRGVCDIGAWDSGGALTGLIEQTSSLPPGTVGLPYSQRLNATGGTGAETYTWSVAAGTLPAGLSLSPSGLIAGSPTGKGSASFTVEVTDLASPAAHVAVKQLSLTVYPRATPAVWVADRTANAIRAFALSLPSAPFTGLAGRATELSGPDGLAFDPVGNLYVANAGTSTITDYQAGARGNSAPIRRITGSATGLASPAGIALDSSGRVYVANDGTQCVTVYATGATGDVAPLRTISGPNTQLDHPRGLAVDAMGHLWVANNGSNSLTEYGITANGDASPIATIAGADTRLANPVGLGQDSVGHLLVGNQSGGSVSEFANPASFGDQAPSLWIGGSAARLTAPTGVDVDAADRLYVADGSGIARFAPGATMPGAVILTGSTSRLTNPSAVAVAPPLAIATGRMPTAALGRRYGQQVQAILGQPPLRWRLVRGRLPRGLTLTRAGLIIGVPRKLGTFRFLVSARDSSPLRMTASRKVTLTIRRAPTVTALLRHVGPARGGQPLTILGRNLAPGQGRTTISFGRIRASHVVCRSTSRCTARTPPHSPGTVRVAVTVDSLSSVGAGTARYTYRRA